MFNSQSSDSQAKLSDELVTLLRQFYYNSLRIINSEQNKLIDASIRENLSITTVEVPHQKGNYWVYLDNIQALGEWLNQPASNSWDDKTYNQPTCVPTSLVFPQGVCPNDVQPQYGDWSRVPMISHDTTYAFSNPNSPTSMSKQDEGNELSICSQMVDEQEKEIAIERINLNLQSIELSIINAEILNLQIKSALETLITTGKRKRENDTRTTESMNKPPLKKVFIGSNSTRFFLPPNPDSSPPNSPPQYSNTR